MCTMRTGRWNRPFGVVAFVAFGASPWMVGCEAEEGDGALETALQDGPPVSELHAPPDARDADGGEVGALGSLTARTDAVKDVVVTLTPDDPVRAGGLQLEALPVDPLDEGAEPVVDIFAPNMPAHGIIRFPAEVVENGDAITSRIEVPMEGWWKIYVDLGPSAGTASLDVHVAPGEGGDHDHHHDHDHGGEDHHGDAGSTPRAHDHGGPTQE